MVLSQYCLDDIAHNYWEAKSGFNFNVLPTIGADIVGPEGFKNPPNIPAHALRLIHPTAKLSEEVNRKLPA